MNASEGVESSSSVGAWAGQAQPVMRILTANRIALAAIGVAPALGMIGWGLSDGWITELLPWLRSLFGLAAPFAPYGTALVAAVAGVIAWASHTHRRISDNRAEWWQRVEFAISLALADDDKVDRYTGMTLLGHLLDDPSVTQADARLLGDVVQALRDESIRSRAVEEAQTLSDVGSPLPDRSARTPPGRMRRLLDRMGLSQPLRQTRR